MIDLFSNAVQFIASIFLLKSNQLFVLQTSLAGGILSNTLLMTGIGFLAGGAYRVEQHFNVVVAQTMGSLLLIAVTSLTVPSVSAIVLNLPQENLIRLSRGTAVVLLIIYGLYLFFQLKTHADMYNTPSEKVPKRRVKVQEGDATKGLAQMGAVASVSMGGANTKAHFADWDSKDEEDQPQISVAVAICVIIISTTLVAFNTQFATDSIQALTETTAVSQTFVGIFLLPLLSNDVTTIFVATKDRMDLCLALTVGKSLQTALLVTPLIVIVAWWIHVGLTLVFSGFEVAALFASTIIVNSLIADGRSNW